MRSSEIEVTFTTLSAVSAVVITISDDVDQVTDMYGSRGESSFSGRDTLHDRV